MDDFEKKNNIVENRIDDFIRDIKNNPNKIRKLWDRAGKNKDSKKYKEASEIYSELVFISLEPTTKDLVNNDQRRLIYLNRGKCYYSLKIYEMAIEDLTTGLNLFNDSNKAGIERYWLLRGECYFKLKMYKMAIDDFTKSVKGLSSQKSLVLRGECFFKLNMYDEADKDFFKAFNRYKEYVTLDEMRTILMGAYKNDKLF